MNGVSCRRKRRAGATLVGAARRVFLRRTGDGKEEALTRSSFFLKEAASPVDRLSSVARLARKGENDQTSQERWNKQENKSAPMRKVGMVWTIKSSNRIESNILKSWSNRIESVVFDSTCLSLRIESGKMGGVFMFYYIFINKYFDSHKRPWNFR